MEAECQQLSFISDQQHQDYRRQTLRLRERLLSERSFESFDDEEVLSTVLSFAGSAKDNGQLIQRLLEAFGSLKGVLEAPPYHLLRVEGMTKAKAGLICMMVPMYRIWQRCIMQTPTRIGNSRDAESFCKSLVLGERIEQFYIIGLNAQCQVLGVRKISDGSLSECSCPPRRVAEVALMLNCHSILACHVHPGGTCAPSPEDIASTIQLQRMLNSIGVLLLDHLIIANDSSYSMVQNGDIDYRIRR